MYADWSSMRYMVCTLTASHRKAAKASARPTRTPALMYRNCEPSLVSKSCASCLPAASAPSFPSFTICCVLTEACVAARASIRALKCFNLFRRQSVVSHSRSAPSTTTCEAFNGTKGGCSRKGCFLVSGLLGGLPMDFRRSASAATSARWSSSKSFTNASGPPTKSVSNASMYTSTSLPGLEEAYFAYSFALRSHACHSCRSLVPSNGVSWPSADPRSTGFPHPSARAEYTRLETPGCDREAASTYVTIVAILEGLLM
mmetsp:Transcript_29060/g.59442  ORF Transcript_29060/g.59442 Transcript_29060/m.59442 type:complete len:258 (-) Transcript_29060:489-1262(-)